MSTEYTYGTLPTVITEDEITITGQGDATIMHANTVNVHSGLLRIHGTETTPIYVNAYGDAIVIAYGNVAVTANDTSRVYGYNNTYIITRGNANAEIFGSGVLVTNDDSQGILYDTAEAICHGNSRALLYGNSTAVAMDTAILSARDTSHAILRGHSQAYAYDASTSVTYDTSTLVVNSLFVQVQAKNSSLITLTEQVAEHVTQQGRYFNFINPENNEEVIGQIHVVDSAGIESEDTQFNEPETESTPSSSNIPETETTRTETPSSLESFDNEDNSNQVHNEEPETTGRHVQTETSTTVADLLARARKAKPEFITETEDTPEPIKATPRHTPRETESPKSQDEPGNLLDSGVIPNDTEAPEFTVDLSDSTDEPIDTGETETQQNLPVIENEAEDIAVDELVNEQETTNTQHNPPNVPLTQGLENQKVNPRPERVRGANPGSEMYAPEGETAVEQLNNQGWYVLTPPSGMQVDFQYTEENENDNAGNAVDSGEKKITGGFDFDDDEEEDEIVLSIPGLDK